MVTAEQERWAEALLVERQRGEKASAFIASRIRTLALAGDEVGIDRWMAIAALYDRLQDSEGGRH